MGINLEAKVGNLLDDIEDLSREDKKKLIVNFVKNELDWHQSTHVIDNYDLNVIHSTAVKEMVDFPVGHIRKTELGGQDQSKLRTLCYVRATIGFLRKQGLLPLIKLDHIKRRKG